MRWMGQRFELNAVRLSELKARLLGLLYCEPKLTQGTPSRYFKLRECVHLYEPMRN
jgi:hypothetical protein